MNRRDVLLAGGAVAAGTALGGMSGCPQNIDVISTVEQLIQKVQQGVATACAAVGKFVPTVDTVAAVVEGFLGATLVQANLAAAVALAQKAIDAIAAQCPQPPPQPSPPAPTVAGPLKANVNGKSVPVIFY